MCICSCACVCVVSLGEEPYLVEAYIRPTGSSFYHPASRSANVEFSPASKVDAGILMVGYNATVIRAW
jgi:hypothetical protein